MAEISWVSTAAWKHIDWVECLRAPIICPDAYLKRSIQSMTSALVFSDILISLHDAGCYVWDLGSICAYTLSPILFSLIAFYSPVRKRVCTICSGTDRDMPVIHEAWNAYRDIEYVKEEISNSNHAFDGPFGNNAHVLSPKEHRYCLTPERYYEADFPDFEPETCTYCGWFPSSPDHDCEEEDGSGEYREVCFSSSAYG